MAERSIDPAELAYQMSFSPHPARVRAIYNGVVIADSERVMRLHETRLAPVFYFPREDVREDLLEITSRVTHCPFKGNATHYTLRVGERYAENAVWGYLDPTADVGNLRDYVAFYWSAVDQWLEDEEPMDEPSGEGGVARDNPLLVWLLGEAAAGYTISSLVSGLAECLGENGVPIVQLRLLVRTLHPQVFARNFTWRPDASEVTEFLLSHQIAEGEDRMLKSPYAPILQGAGGVRRRIEGDDAKLDYPILSELRDSGATDYLALPLPFSDGQINILSIATSRPGGFLVEELGLLHEILPGLARLVEVPAMRHVAESLLETYIGAHTGARVLAGKIRRGDGEDLHAVIWLCDLRDSTRLTEELGRARYLELLSDFFDATAGAVLDHGGEVLKFIGDAVLAIFPVTPGVEPAASARAALLAAQEARRRVHRLDARRRARAEPGVAFGVALHRGDLTYGNIGTAGRLDFTAIGSAINEASRMESMAKEFGTWLVASREVAEALPAEFRSLGERAMRGVADAREIFTILEATE